MSKPLIRCDDYPYGDPRHIDTLMKNGLSYSAAQGTLRSVCIEVMKILEEYNVDYIWGVSPMLLAKEDIDLLNGVTKKGLLVLHGFDHGVSVIPKENWHNIHNIYHDGGEFSIYKSRKSLLADYNMACQIMSNFKNFDGSKFIPPFNSYNQIFLDVIATSEVKTLYICNTEYEKFLHKLNHYHLELSISEEGTSYSSIDYVTENWDSVKSHPHICLHPIYDIINSGDGFSGIEKYRNFASKIYNA